MFENNMSSHPSNPAKTQPLSTTCRTCSSSSLQCNGIRPWRAPCKNGNKTCVWPEEGPGPRRGSFPTSTRPSNLITEQQSARSTRSRTSQPARSLFASERQRHPSGKFLKPAATAGGDGLQQTQTQRGGQKGKQKQSQQPVTKRSAAMRCVDYKKLVEGDMVAKAEMLAACEEQGCFWLDLASEQELLKRVEWLLRMAQRLHDVEQVEKWRYEEERRDSYNNIRYEYTALPSPHSDEETDFHLSEMWSVDLFPYTHSALLEPSFAAKEGSFDWPTPLQNGHGNEVLVTAAKIHSVGLALLNVLEGADPNADALSQNGIIFSRYPVDVVDDSQSQFQFQLQKLVQMREARDGGGMDIVFAPVPGTRVLDVGTGNVVSVERDEGMEGVRWACVCMGGRGKRVARDLEVWRGRVEEGVGDWFEVCAGLREGVGTGEEEGDVETEQG